MWAQRVAYRAAQLDRLGLMIEKLSESEIQGTQRPQVLVAGANGECLSVAVPLESGAAAAAAAVISVRSSVFVRRFCLYRCSERDAATATGRFNDFGVI